MSPSISTGTSSATGNSTTETSTSSSVSSQAISYTRDSSSAPNVPSTEGLVFQSKRRGKLKVLYDPGFRNVSGSQQASTTRNPDAVSTPNSNQSSGNFQANEQRDILTNGVSELIRFVREANISKVKELLHSRSQQQDENLRNSFINEATDSTKNTALHYACVGPNFIRGPHTELVELLLSHGADPNALNIAQETPLHCAAKFSHDDRICKLLLEKGAKKDLKNLAGMKPIDMAQIETCKEVLGV